jgi:hypothetical protein
MQSTGCLALKRNDVDVVTSSADRRLEFLVGDRLTAAIREIDWAGMNKARVECN